MEPQFLRAFVPEDVRASVATAAAGTPIRFVASTDLPARDGLRIPISAWRTEEYLTNPIVLINHNFQALPVGRTVKLEATDHALYADIEFDQQDIEAKAVESKIRRGFVNSCSVSWDTVLRDGETVKEATLLDISIVSVPADPRALAERQRRGLAEMAHNILQVVEPPEPADPPNPTPDPSVTDPPSARPTWDEAAALMVRLFQPFGQRPDEERKTEYASLARAYARADKVPPEFRTNRDLDALGAPEIRGLFLAGEPELFPDVFAALETRAGAVLSARNLERLDQIIGLANEIRTSAKKEAKTDDTTDEERAAADELERLRKLLGDDET